MELLKMPHNAIANGLNVDAVVIQIAGYERTEHIIVVIVTMTRIQERTIGKLTS